MQDSRPLPPFKTLGTHLKYLREKSAETLAEVSGAVEIDEDILDRIEQGVERPSEDVLMLLISHFNMLDNEALQIWELAGYDRRNNPEILDALQDDFSADGQPGRTIMLLAVDIRTQYSDGVDVAVSNAGVVMTFTQAGGLGRPQPVARVGMSLQQAEAVVEALRQSLLESRYQGPKRLPPPASEQSDATLRRRSTPNN